MERIGKSVVVAEGSRLESSGRAIATAARRPNFTADNLPLSYDHIVDFSLPQKLWSAWAEAGKPRELRRPLTQTERATVQRRVELLEPALLPFARPQEDDRVMAAIDEMFASYSSTRLADDALMARLRGFVESSADMPVWAIEQACLTIRRHGYEIREGDRKRVEQTWAPSEAQFHAVVELVVEQRAKALTSARALLAAPAQGIEPEVDPGSVAAMHADFKTKMAGGALLAQMEDADRDRIIGEASQRALQRRRDDYVAAGLDPPAGVTFASLPMLLKRGWTIEERISGNVLIAPARASVGPAPKRPTQANEMGS